MATNLYDKSTKHMFTFKEFRFFGCFVQQLSYIFYCNHGGRSNAVQSLPLSLKSVLSVNELRSCRQPALIYLIATMPRRPRSNNDNDDIPLRSNLIWTRNSHIKSNRKRPNKGYPRSYFLVNSHSLIKRKDINQELIYFIMLWVNLIKSLQFSEGIFFVFYYDHNIFLLDETSFSQSIFT